jgi:hypothetical protein
MTQMHAYTLITHEDRSIHHGSNYSDILPASTITAHTYYHHHILLASTITAHILLTSPHTTSIYHHSSYYYHHRLMEIQPLHVVQQNMSPGLDTPPKRDA